MIEVVPAVIPQTFREIEERILKVKGKTNKFQIDFADGKFVKTKTWPFNLDEHPGLPAIHVMPRTPGDVEKQNRGMVVDFN